MTKRSIQNPSHAVALQKAVLKNLRKVTAKHQEIEAVPRRCSVKKVFLKTSRKFTGKQLRRGFFFNKV